jgi:hypothetical protein
MKGYVKNFLLSPVCSLLVVVASLYGYHTFFFKRIGYVRTGEAITSFNGIKEAPKQFESEFRIAQANTDTLRNRLKSLKHNLSLKRKSSQEWLYTDTQKKEEYGKEFDNAISTVKCQYLPTAHSSAMSFCFFVIKESEKTFRSLLYDYQRSYGNSPNVTLLFASPKSSTITSQEKELKCYYKDQLWGIPQVIQLVFNNEKLKESAPALIF